jgi:hypothetical protein
MCGRSALGWYKSGMKSGKFGTKGGKFGTKEGKFGTFLKRLRRVEGATWFHFSSPPGRLICVEISILPCPMARSTGFQMGSEAGRE